jgi:hypothetical protein
MSALYRLVGVATDPRIENIARGRSYLRSKAGQRSGLQPYHGERVLGPQ